MKFIFETRPSPGLKNDIKWTAYLNKADQGNYHPLCRGYETSQEGRTDATVEDAGGISLASRFFKNKEEAALVVYEIREALQKCPVPNETQELIKQLVEDTRRDSRELQSVQAGLHHRFRQLFYHAKKLGVKLRLDEDDVDATAAFRELLAWVPEFGLSVEQLKSAGEVSGIPFNENDERAAAERRLPFLSQSVVYPLLGKECARTFYALLKNAITLAGLQWEEIEPQ